MTVVTPAAVAVPLVLKVAVETPAHSGLSGTLDYTSDRPLAAGTLVRVPLGARTVLGVVWAADEPAEGRANRPGLSSGVALREIAQVWQRLPPLTQAWRQLVEFAASYYQRSVGEVAMSALPPDLRVLDDIQLERRLKRMARQLESAPAGRQAEPPRVPALTPEQDAVLACLRQGPAAGVNLLHGATGSGKTEVYLREVERVLAAGGQVLVLVPEINLTPQLLERFTQRLVGRRVAALHSGLTSAQRVQHWLQAHLGHADVVLGTRLSVFTPLPRLGLIIVDEEHEPSFKQQEGARYSARDLAVYRGRLEGVPVILGSATPSLETWFNALPEIGRYRLLAMPNRVGGGVWPALRFVDWSQEKRAGRQTMASDELPLAQPLLKAMAERVERGEQSLVLLNRRGYAPVLHCPDCGWQSACQHCSAWRVFHKDDRTLRCHHCGLSERVPRACPECGNLDIRPLGRGTERLEEQLAAALPQARIARIDADVSRKRGALEAQLASVHAGEVDVLVGTQMVAKGHDFRRMTLVAAVNPDSALFSSDFRAPERLFALLMQAAGRAGRDAQAAGRSEMWLQTWYPQHPLYAALATYDYAAYATSQLAERRVASLPPYTFLALLRAEAKQQSWALAYLTAASAAALPLAQAHGVTLYPPVPTPISRVANVERTQMLLEASSRAALQRLLAQWGPQLHELAKTHRQAKTPVLRWAIDVDPLAI